jgi:hypothetical protein
VCDPGELAEAEPLTRERNTGVLEPLPVGETAPHGEAVSIELSTMMPATLLDFPFADRRKPAAGAMCMANRRAPRRRS